MNLERTGKVTMEPRKDCDNPCPLFGVGSGGPVIGLGILMILFALVPLLIIPGSFPLPLGIVFVGFGLFLVWIGFAR